MSRSTTRRSGGTIRVAVVDDHAAIRIGLKSAIASRPGLVCVGVAADGEEMDPLLYRTRPDAVILDYHLPRTDGLLLCRRIKASVPTPAVLLYSAYADPSLVVPALVAGADGIVHKGAPARELFEALHAVAIGGTHLPALIPELTSGRTRRARPRRPADPRHAHRLHAARGDRRQARTAPRSVRSARGAHARPAACARAAPQRQRERDALKVDARDHAGMDARTHWNRRLAKRPWEHVHARRHSRARRRRAHGRGSACAVPWRARHGCGGGADRRSRARALGRRRRRRRRRRGRRHRRARRHRARLAAGREVARRRAAWRFAAVRAHSRAAWRRCAPCRRRLVRCNSTARSGAPACGISRRRACRWPKAAPSSSSRSMA